MSDSILANTKKVLGFPDDDTSFDFDVMLHINSVFSTLNQLGVGPASGFAIEDDTAVWSDFLGDDPRLNSVKTYIYLRVRLLVDPPGTSYLITAFEKQIEEMAWRITVQKDYDDSVQTPLPLTPTYNLTVVDGGTP